MTRGGRFLSLGLSLALLWARAASAAVLAAVPIPEVALAPIGVPAVILGSPSSMPVPLAQTLSAQQVLLSAMPAPMIAPHVVALAASQVPYERAAAKLLAHSLVETQPALAPLAESARKDPAFSAWFDGASAKKEDHFDGLVYKGGVWRDGDAKLQRLGRGEFGFVDVNPRVEGAVMKTTAHSSTVELLTTDGPDKTSEKEQATADALAAADAGPRHFGRFNPLGYYVSLRERVYGKTLHDMMRAREFGEEEKELMLDLVRRLAKANLLVNDMRPENIMIGRTLLDPRRRAYVVDGGGIIPIPEGLDENGRVDFILKNPISLRGRMDRYVGWIEYALPLNTIMADGIARKNQVTRWQRLKGWWSEMLQHY